MAGIESFLGGIAKFVGYESPEEKERKEAGEENRKNQHAAKIAKGEVLKRNLEEAKKYLKENLAQKRLNTADRLKSKHGAGLIDDVDPDVRAKINEEKNKMSRKKIKQEAAQIEGAPLQSTADAQGEAPATVEQLLTNINEQLTMVIFLEKGNLILLKDQPIANLADDIELNPFGDSRS